MEEITSNRRGKINNTLLFILVIGIISSLLLMGNFFLSYVIGNGAIYTGIVTLLLIMTILMKTYFKYFKKEMGFIDTLVVGLPVFIMSTVACFVIGNYDFAGNVVYSHYTNGYFLHTLEETAKQFIPVTLFFVLLFAPVYRQMRKLKLNKSKIGY